MPKQKYDWSKIKLEFFQSDIDDVEGFLGDFLGIKNSGNIRKNTKGRWKEKQEYKEKILQEALRKNAEKQIQSLEIPIEILKRGKKNWIIGIIKDLSEKSEHLSMSDKVKGVNQLKIELWEPTSFSKTDTTLRGDPLDESLFVED